MQMLAGQTYKQNGLPIWWGKVVGSGKMWKLIMGDVQFFAKCDPQSSLDHTISRYVSFRTRNKSCQPSFKCSLRSGWSRPTKINFKSLFFFYFQAWIRFWCSLVVLTFALFLSTLPVIRFGPGKKKNISIIRSPTLIYNKAADLISDLSFAEFPLSVFICLLIAFYATLDSAMLVCRSIGPSFGWSVGQLFRGSPLWAVSPEGRCLVGHRSEFPYIRP